MMSTRSGRSSIDRRTAERLLRGDRGTAGAGHDRLARLLAGAAAPARPSELALEETAVRAFREAYRSPVPRHQRQSMIKSVAAKLLTVKVAALAAATVGVGGVALAATTGTIPSPLNGSSTAASQGPDQDAGKSSDRPASHGPGARPSKPAVPSDYPPGLYWLCNDYIGRDADHRGKALDEEKFRELADRTGKDRDNADKFCDKLLDQSGNGSTGGESTDNPGRPDSTPGGQKPSSLPTARNSRPSGAPDTPHPTR
jgi:hypothetical protein